MIKTWNVKEDSYMCIALITLNRVDSMELEQITMDNPVRHGLMPVWFEDLMNVTEKFQFIEPMFRHSCLVPSSGVI